MKFVKIWIFRRLVQTLVLLSLFAFPIIGIYSHYLSTRKIDQVITKWEGTLPGEILNATDKVLRIGIPDGEGGVSTRRPRKAILERTREHYGSVWSARLFGISMTDLLAGAESVVTSHTATQVLLISLLLPLVVTLLFGRIFCSWICPMGFLFEIGEKFRSVVRFLEIRPLHIHFSPVNKYILLVLGLVFSFFLTIPLLQYIYPPALLGREAQVFTNTLFDRAEGGKLHFAFIGFTSISVFLIVLFFIDSFVAPRFWCRSICPGGAIYSLLGKLRLVRVRRDSSQCVPCNDCNKACPMALKPMNDLTGMECDNCGVCLDVCPENALHYKFSLSSQSFQKTASSPKTSLLQKNVSKVVTKSVLLFVFFSFFFGAVPSAHHILGIPHYSYDESYPQAPILKLVEIVGHLEFQLTSYPGQPKPGIRTEIHLYVSEKQTRELYQKPITMMIRKQAIFESSEETVYGPQTSNITQNLYKFYPTYPTDGNYMVKLSFEDETGISTMEFPMVVGEPGSPWTVLFSFLGGMGFFVIVIRAIRIKHLRRLRQEVPS